MLLSQRRVSVLVALMSVGSSSWTHARTLASNKLAFLSFYRRRLPRRLQFTPQIAPTRRYLAGKATESSNETQRGPLIRLDIPTAQDMEDFGALLSTLICTTEQNPRGTVIFLDGDLGAGKTALARGFVRACTGNQRVTSPTYLLSNTYQVPDKDDLE